MIRFHQPNESYGFLSNYFAATIEMDGLAWPTVEHYFQAQKFPHDAALREEIRRLPNPNAARTLAWSRSDIRPDWELVRDDVMWMAIAAKFTQNANLCAALLATGYEPLAEHTKRDAYWGDGGDGSGVNRLGELLGELRLKLAAKAEPSINRVILDWLLATGQIQIQDSRFLHVSPPSKQIAWERVQGMLMGLAIGDALGNRTEAQSPYNRLQSHDEIRDYLPNGYAGQRAVGLPSDDSQMAFMTLEQMLADGALIPQALAQSFCSHPIFGIGSTVRTFLAAFRDEKLPWYRAAQPSAGNGALMRIAPVILPYVKAPSAELWSDLALAAMLTHNDTASIASCVAFGGMLLELLGMTRPPDRDWWRARFVEIVRQLELPQSYMPRSNHLPQEARTFSTWIDALLSDPHLPFMTTLDACERWYSAAFLLETVPSALFILQRYAHDPEEAIVRAVNDTYDNDTTAAIVGAAVGALHGVDALPQRWRAGLLGRLGADDDGAMFMLMDKAGERWG